MRPGYYSMICGEVRYVTYTAREFSGHKTDSVFDRYNITDFDDLKDAAARLQRYLTGK